MTPTILLDLFVVLGLFASPAGHDAAAPSQPPPTLRVVSYNAWLLPLVSSEFLARREQIPPALAALEPDVLCLQEVWDQGSLDAITGHLAHRLPHRLEAGGGLALVSRYPVRAWYFQPFPDHEALSFFERFAKKGYVSAVLETPAGYVRVVVTHLAHARGEDRPAHTAQLETLADALATERRLPTILCGDLNFRAVTGGAPSDELRTLLALGFTDPALPPENGDGTRARRAPTRIGWPREPGRVRGGDPDYILYRPGRALDLRPLAYRQALDTPETALSDHNALVIDLTLERHTGPRTAITP